MTRANSPAMAHPRGNGHTAADTPGEVAPVVLEARSLRKAYGGTVALSNGALAIHRGEIHGLLGQNGCGKSTLLKILTGLEQADAGELQLDGHPARFANPQAALSVGIAIVTQETTLASDLSVAENVLLGGRQVRTRRGIRWGQTRQKTQEILHSLGVAISPLATVADLRPGHQQMVEIARALAVDARVLILDEPTTSLTDEEVGPLFDVVRSLSRRGVAVVLVSHRMREIREVTQRVTILRDGRTVAAEPTSDLSDGQMILHMVGSETKVFERDTDRPAGDGRGSSVLSLAYRGASDETIDVGRNEIVGLAGLTGSGRSELLAQCFGADPRGEAEVRIDGRAVQLRSPGAAMAAGLGYVPADRKLQGLVLGLTVRENLLLTDSASRRPWHRLRLRAESDSVRELAAAVGLPTGRENHPVESLSGGNQQKVLIGKSLRHKPKVLILDEPTRGVDVAAKAEIYRLLNAARRDGLSVLVSSSETPELLTLCDRIYVMYRSRVVGCLTSEDATEARITHYATGATT